ncbi:MAG TPA: hypothetical protein VF506_13535 [Streptosporangiaceae bacterium]
MAYADIPITAGSGTQVRSFQLGAGDYDQVVREARATAMSAAVAWTATTAGTASVLSADVTRVGLLIVSQATGTVYLRFDSTIPSIVAGTAPLYHWYLQPQDRYEVPIQYCTLAVSLVASTSGGFVHLVSGTAA